MIFYILSVLLIGLNGGYYFTYFLSESNIPFSSLGLPGSIDQECRYFPIHDCVPGSRVKYAR